jgi:hypothetical protein
MRGGSQSGYRYILTKGTSGMAALNSGDELLTIPTAEFNRIVSFALQVSLNESAVSEGSPLIMSLRFISTMVKLAIDSPAPFL